MLVHERAGEMSTWRERIARTRCKKEPVSRYGGVTELFYLYVVSGGCIAGAMLVHEYLWQVSDKLSTAYRESSYVGHAVHNTRSCSKNWDRRSPRHARSATPGLVKGTASCRQGGVIYTSRRNFRIVTAAFQVLHDLAEVPNL
jgi:hypothetical protein